MMHEKSFAGEQHSLNNLTHALQITIVKPLFILLFAVQAFISSCRHSTVETDYIKAKVVAVKDLACAVPLLDFEEDSVKIRLATKESSLLYGVTQLPDSLRIENMKLYVRVQKLAPQDEFVCNTFGIPYPHLRIIDVKER